MTSPFLRAYSYFFIIALLFLVNGCIHSGKRDLTADPQTQKIITSIQHANAELKTFKGIGSVKLVSDNQNSSFRLAWAGEAPEKLRLIILMSGKSIETFAANGKRIFLKSHTGAHDLINRKSNNASLKRLISIPVKTKEIISLLSGKIPVAKYKYARLIQIPDQEGYILELSKPWWGVVERIFLNSNETVTGFEMVKGDHSTYRVSLNDFKSVNDFTLPYEILIESEKARCKLTYTNYFTNPEITPATFEIKIR